MEIKVAARDLKKILYTYLITKKYAVLICIYILYIYHIRV